MRISPLEMFPSLSEYVSAMYLSQLDLRDSRASHGRKNRVFFLQILHGLFGKARIYSFDALGSINDDQDEVYIRPDFHPLL